MVADRDWHADCRQLTRENVTLDNRQKVGEECEWSDSIVHRSWRLNGLVVYKLALIHNVLRWSTLPTLQRLHYVSTNANNMAFWLNFNTQE
jgi:hypothetical protein